MKTAFEIACDAYQLRKEAEHRVRLRALQHEMARWPLSPPPSPNPPHLLAGAGPREPLTA